MDVHIYTFRAKNIKCKSCESVNSFTPDAKITALEAWVLIPLANELVLEIKEKEFYAEEKITYSKHGTVTQEQINELIKLRKSRINKYYQFLIDSIPEKEKLYTREKEERLKWAEIVRT